MQMRSVLTTAAIVCSTSAWAATPGTVETWDDNVAGVNGWTGNTTSATVVHATAGGNPNGHILTRKSLSPPIFDIGALTSTNPDFTGDYNAAGVGQVSFDVLAQTNDLTDIWVRFRSGAGVNGWLYPFGAQAESTNWESYAVAFDTSWTDAEAKLAGWLEDQDVDPTAIPSISWAATLSNVVTAEVRLASSDSSTIAGIDNFAIDVPEPAAVGLLGLGALTMLRRRSA